MNSTNRPFYTSLFTLPELDKKRIETETDEVRNKLDIIKQMAVDKLVNGRLDQLHLARGRSNYLLRCLKAEEFPYPRNGICSLSATCLLNLVPVRVFCISLGKYSGEPSYPIPGGSAAFSASFDKWTRSLEYGRTRREVAELYWTCGKNLGFWESVLDWEFHYSTNRETVSLIPTVTVERVEEFLKTDGPK